MAGPETAVTAISDVPAATRLFLRASSIVNIARYVVMFLAFFHLRRVRKKTEEARRKLASHQKRKFVKSRRQQRRQSLWVREGGEVSQNDKDVKASFHSARIPERTHPPAHTNNKY
ncbi:hypothetical protein CSUI_007775 [Cystoisospora suis]|uniref:Transmembrane protein n=1 Tax=Cystoisospora suis TaxID=483139 RepID=A0A2C6KCF9_9APIC|nr:hypothetical protein CSUI_007775 [Cystoisospora suis]